MLSFHGLPNQSQQPQIYFPAAPPAQPRWHAELICMAGAAGRQGDGSTRPQGSVRGHLPPDKLEEIGMFGKETQVRKRPKPTQLIRL